MGIGDQGSRTRGRGSGASAPRLVWLLLWLPVAVIVTMLCLRFGMRAVGVRDDIPFPSLVYAVTSPLVTPFYRFFPSDARLDYPVVEVASLVAAGAVLAVALAVYVVGLLIARGDDGQ